MNHLGKRSRRRVFAARIILTSIAAALVGPAPGAQVSFIPLGDLPGGPVESQAFGISADGSAVVGQSRPSVGTMAFRWTEAGGMVGLGYLPGGSGASVARAVSADGTVVVGDSNSPGHFTQAFRWTAATGMVGLSDLNGGLQLCVAHAVSADGSIVAGAGTAGFTDEAVRWIGGTVAQRVHIYTGSNAYSTSFALSADGAVSGGFGASPFSASARSFVWLNGSGLYLGLTAGTSGTSQVTGLSAIGDVAVGCSTTSGVMRPFRWTVDAGLSALPGLPGGSTGTARALSADGAFVVGTEKVGTVQHAVGWTQDAGTIAIKDFLLSNGFDIGAWRLTEAVGVSADGLAIVGNGFNPSGQREAWLVRIVLRTDSDGDGLYDDEDAFPHSIMTETVVIGDIDCGVVNDVFPDGATMADLINANAVEARNHGDFVSAMAHLTNAWVEEGVVTHKERGTMQPAAARTK